MMNENLDRRVLAGFRCVDAITGLSVVQPLSVAGTGLVLRRNRSGVFAVVDAPGLNGLTTHFLPPAPASWPVLSNHEVVIEDPSFRYLSRRAVIAVPQPLPAEIVTGTPPPPTTTPAGGPTVPPLTMPQDIVMYPTAAAPVSGNWAVIRVSVFSDDKPAVFLPWAVVQVSITAMPPVTGLTNQLGQALAAVPGLGLQLSSSPTGAVTETTTPATVTAWFDPAALKQPRGWVTNPDDILTDLASTRLKTTSKAVELAPSQTVLVNLVISMT